jgi:hypothetical protein
MAGSRMQRIAAGTGAPTGALMRGHDVVRIPAPFAEDVANAQLSGGSIAFAGTPALPNECGFSRSHQRKSPGGHPPGPFSTDPLFGPYGPIATPPDRLLPVVDVLIVTTVPALIAVDVNAVLPVVPVPLTTQVPIVVPPTTIAKLSCFPAPGATVIAQ